MLEHILVVVKRMEFPEYILVAVNLVAGFGFAVALAGMLRKAYGERTTFLRYFVLLIGVYFVECAAVAMGMGIPVFSMGMAFVWGIVRFSGNRFFCRCTQVCRRFLSSLSLCFCRFQGLL
ncbi:MAG: hypothetical protein ACYSTG_05425 [Planctomycetota bacterium]|jgi:hypothetical protein